MCTFKQTYIHTQTQLTCWRVCSWTRGCCSQYLRKCQVFKHESPCFTMKLHLTNYCWSKPLLRHKKILDMFLSRSRSLTKSNRVTSLTEILIINEIHCKHLVVLSTRAKTSKTDWAKLFSSQHNFNLINASVFVNQTILFFNHCSTITSLV